MSERTKPDVGNLSDDPALLKEIIVQQNALLVQQRNEIDKLRHEIDQLRRMHFGPRSERVVPEQMVMSFMANSYPAQLPPAGTPPREHTRDPQHFDATQAISTNGHGRQTLPAHLRRERRVFDVPEDKKRCGGCKKPLVKIGEDTSEQLEYTPSQLKVLQNVRPKYACENECEETGIVVAPPPPGPIEKGLPGPALLAHTVVSKYDDHLPLYRQQEIFARQGVHLARQTLCGWSGGAAELLRPLTDLMTRRVLLSKKIHTDDTPVPVLDPDLKHTREAHLWVYIGDEANPYVVFQYSPTHAEKYAIEFLKDYLEYLQCDAYPGYDKVRAIVVGCWAHVRRYFFEAQKTEPARSAIALGYIRQLYKVEELAQEKSPAERLALRQEHSRKATQELKKWMEKEELSVLPESALGKAFGYARNQWARLVRYLDDPALDIDNNIAERALRGVVIGKKNWLFAGSDQGGEHAAILYSMIESAKRNGVEPQAYLTDLFTRIPNARMSELEKFLPDRWKPPNTS
jgi:transposase